LLSSLRGGPAGSRGASSSRTSRAQRLGQAHHLDLLVQRVGPVPDRPQPVEGGRVLAGRVAVRGAAHRRLLQLQPQPAAEVPGQAPQRLVARQPRGYITREKKVLVATDVGRYLIALVRDRALKSPELTGEWEAQLREIEAGRLDPGQFMGEISRYAGEIIRTAEAAAVDETRLGDCPRCGRPVIEGKRGFGCSGWKEGCPFVLWKEYRGSPLNLGQVRELLQRRVLLRPLTVEGSGAVVLHLSDAGALLEIPVPRENPRPAATARSRQSSRRPVGNARRREPALDEAPATEADGNVAAQGTGARGPAAGKTEGSARALSPLWFAGRRAGALLRLQRLAERVQVCHLEDGRRQTAQRSHGPDASASGPEPAAQGLPVEVREALLGAAEAGGRCGPLRLRALIAPLRLCISPPWGGGRPMLTRLASTARRLHKTDPATASKASLVRSLLCRSRPGGPALTHPLPFHPAAVAARSATRGVARSRPMFGRDGCG
jgi:hypothetical protein